MPSARDHGGVFFAMVGSDGRWLFDLGDHRMGRIYTRWRSWSAPATVPGAPSPLGWWGPTPVPGPFLGASAHSSS